MECLSHRASRERRTAREQVVEQRAQRIDVAARTDFAELLRGLFGRHVARRTKRLTAHGQVRAVRQLFGQTEVGDARLVERINEHVGRFEVAVQHAALMGIVDGLCDLFYVPRRLFGRQRSCAYEIGKIVPLDEIHREIGLAFRLAHFVDTDDVRMLETRRCLRLRTEPFDRRPAGELTGQDHLERHLTVEIGLVSAIDHAHSTARDLSQEFVIAKGTGKQFRRGSVRLAHRRGLQRHLHQTLRAVAGKDLRRERRAAPCAVSRHIAVITTRRRLTGLCRRGSDANQRHFACRYETARGLTRAVTLLLSKSPC